MILSKKFGLAVALLSSVYTSSAQSPRHAEKSKKIQAAVEEIVENAEIPGMVAAIVSAEGVVAMGSAGVRKEGSREEFTEDDVIHIGSCTKAMTSVLIAILVKEKRLTWETTIIEVLPELKKSIHEDYHTVTVWELLTHRSGLPSSAKDWWDHDSMKMQKRRISLMKDTLEDAPTNKRGEYLYSNFGYMVAGCMAEKVTDSTWEELMQERIFDPLGMKSAGFGPPGKRGRTDQPWGHSKKGDAWIPSQSDNAAALGPAGTVHCTVGDWAKFIAIQLPNGNHLSLSQTQLNKLITPTGTYAAGWGIGTRPWAKGIVLTHNGSNTMWYATVWVAPKLDRAFIVVTNSKDDHSNSVNDKMIGKLIALDKGY